MKTTSKYVTIAEHEKKRADQFAASLIEARQELNKIDQERDADRKEIERLRNHNLQLRGALEAEESELRARLNMIYHRIGMIPVEPQVPNDWSTATGYWTKSHAKLVPGTINKP